MAEMPRTFTALAEVRLASPEPVMLRLCAHFREFGEVTVDGPCCRIDTGFGVAGLEACKGCLKISAEGKDAVALAYVKLALAEHLGVGTRDLKRIEVVGTPIAKARYKFPTLPELTMA